MIDIEQFASTQDIEDRFQIATYKKMNFAIERGRGARVWTGAGDEFLIFTAGTRSARPGTRILTSSMP